jgi:uncharacterized repeat protein (TIGR03803 family)
MRTLIYALIAALALPAAVQAKPLHYTLLHNFCTQGDCADGSSPTAGLVRDTKGNLFGAAETGGAHNNGVVFELERHHKSYALNVLHDFCFSCGDGDFPFAGLILDMNGNLYGTTLGGGAHDCGIVFQLSPAKKKYKVLHDFCAQDGDGDSPDQPLSYAGKSSGAPYDGVSPLYGTTANGGANGRGTVFSLTPNGKHWNTQILYAFCAQQGCADGGSPTGEVLVDGSGNLFGNVGQGGPAGAVYELSPSGGASMTEKIIHAFCAPDDCSDGQGPIGTLVKTQSGEIFGTTVNALGSEGGAIFRLAPNGADWDESLVHVFCTGKCADGYFPSGGLIADTHGNIYGLNELGGTGENGVGGGVAYRLKDSKLTLLYEFCSEAGCADGRVPMGTLTVDSSGNLFGMTSQGGPVTAAGTAFELRP